ncbi:MAG: DNA mismatch endonuclease Vsr [Pseudomonadota bacterium]
MTDKISKQRRSENMRRITSKNTSPEIIVRKLVHSIGYRFRLHKKDLPGKPDLVLAKYRIAIFVHGCFWHQHGDKTCKIARIPKSRPEYWIPKLARNVERDEIHREALIALGWQPHVVWECETQDQNLLKNIISKILPEKN